MSRCVRISAALSLFALAVAFGGGTARADSGRAGAPDPALGAEHVLPSDISAAMRGRGGGGGGPRISRGGGGGPRISRGGGGGPRVSRGGGGPRAAAIRRGPRVSAPRRAAVRPVAKRPAQRPVVKRPTKQPIAKRPAKQPVAKRPGKQPLAKRPAERPVAKGPVQRPQVKRPGTRPKGNEAQPAVNRPQGKNRPQPAINRPPLRIQRIAPRVAFIPFRGQRWAIIRGPRIIYRGTLIRRLVPITALAAVTFAGQPFYANGYVAAPQPICSGRTEEGCMLSWQNVPTEEGDTEPQCVQYCPSGYAPVQQAAGPAPRLTAPEPRRGCEIINYDDADFRGAEWRVNSDQPALGEWDKRIASIQVNAGTWDFFLDENYGGEVMRLAPGQYRDLADWTRQISSMMCLQPSN